MEWREIILKGIKVLPKQDVPGRIVVFGKQAEPILTGKSAEDVFVAAAEYGKGRIVAISDHSYSPMFSQDDETLGGALKEFHNNLKQWLTKETFQKNDSIINARDEVNLEKIKSSKIVVYDGGKVKIDPPDLTEFVHNGGALLYCETPWGWSHVNGGKPISDAPYAALLNDAGLCFTDEYIWDTEFSVMDNKAADAHILRTLGEAVKEFNITEDQVNVLNRWTYVPANVFLKFKSLWEKLFETCQDELKIPSKQNPVRDKKDQAILSIWLLCVKLFQLEHIKAPGVELFPFDFSIDPPLKTHTLEFHSDREDFHSTACYLPAGQTLKVEVESGNEGQDWQLLIGCHTDELQDQEELRRWPVVYKKVKLTQKSQELSTLFGGLIYLISPNKESQSITVKLENVVDSPRFKLTEGEKGKESWELSRQSPGLWADIEGRFIAMTLPASSVKEMEFDALTSVMKTWDSVVSLSHDLRGTDVSKNRREWFVTDEQPGGGYMHAGYPMVTHMDVSVPTNEFFLLNGSVAKVGHWYPFHEIGHNMQRNEWTFEGTREVTGEIFNLYAMDTICHIKPWIHKWLRDQLTPTQKFLNEGANFEEWKKSSVIALFVYAQLAHEFGWESYRKVFHRYEAMGKSERPTDDQKKIDTWFSIFSETVGCNLAPLASFWGIPLSSEAIADLNAAFPSGFLPDDEVTRFAPDRVDDVLLKFPGIVREKCSSHLF